MRNRFLLFLIFAMMIFPKFSLAMTAEEIDLKTDAALENFKTKVYGSADIIQRSKGVLVIPRVYKGGIGIGAEYGQGALRINGQTVNYYSFVGGSFGFQLGFQVRSLYLFFMEDSALDGFRAGSGWQAGIDGSVALISVGADGSIDTRKTDEPIVAFVLGQKGLMYNLTLEGAKFNKLVK
ncbi:MAG: hypothetical protein HYZ84_06775 [Candidatus Omnitrophica bacterium]|nr:hypothetical protein [Candidatus Omnitrophota bacterium]